MPLLYVSVFIQWVKCTYLLYAFHSMYVTIKAVEWILLNLSALLIFNQLSSLTELSGSSSTMTATAEK